MPSMLVPGLRSKRHPGASSVHQWLSGESHTPAASLIVEVLRVKRRKWELSQPPQAACVGKHESNASTGRRRRNSDERLYRRTRLEREELSERRQLSRSENHANFVRHARARPIMTVPAGKGIAGWYNDCMRMQSASANIALVPCRCAMRSADAAAMPLPVCYYSRAHRRGACWRLRLDSIFCCDDCYRRRSSVSTRLLLS